MLSMCSATPSYHFQSMNPFYEGPRCFLPEKVFQIRCADGNIGLSNSTHSLGVSFHTHATSSFDFHFFTSTEQLDPIHSVNVPSLTEIINYGFLDKWNRPPPDKMNEFGCMRRMELELAAEKDFTKFEGWLMETSNDLSGVADSETQSAIDVASGNSGFGSGGMNMDGDSLSKLRMIVSDFFIPIVESIGVSVNKGETSVKSFIDSTNYSVVSAIKNGNEAIESSVNRLFSTPDYVGELTHNGFRSLSSNLKDASVKAGFIVTDILRIVIVSVGNFLTNGANSVIYSYGFAKELLPQGFQISLKLSEEQATKILTPIGTALQQAYVVIETLEIALGLDPNDPLVPFFLLLGTSTTFWICFWSFTYGGYAGDLSPKSTLKLLTEKHDVVLIDVRPESLRKKDGVPDLRRASRFRYVNITLPQLDGSLQKLLKSGRELDDSLVSVIIRNLKTVRENSIIIIMDADGTRSKGIARSLKKLGVKYPFLVQGGFRCWVRESLPVKELKPETTLSIINEEVEAILEDISLNPLEYIIWGVGIIGAVFAIVEWEKALQLIGVVGLCQAIYWRVSSYEDSRDFKYDVRRLLGFVKLGVLPLAWAAGLLNPNHGNGLPTSPSSSDVQSRVLQAVVKHESQPPSDTAQQDFRESTTESV